MIAKSIKKKEWWENQTIAMIFRKCQRFSYFQTYWSDANPQKDLDDIFYHDSMCWCHQIPLPYRKRKKSNQTRLLFWWDRWDRRGGLGLSFNNCVLSPLYGRWDLYARENWNNLIPAATAAVWCAVYSYYFTVLPVVNDDAVVFDVGVSLQGERTSCSRDGE